VSSFDVIIKNGRIWDGTKFLDDVHDVAIKDGVVAKIGNISETAQYVFDAAENIISPGLIDIHTHMKGVSSDDFGVSAESVCYRFGVTTAVEACASNLAGSQLLDNYLLKSYVFVASDVKDNDACFEATDNLIKAYGNRVLGIKVFFETSPEVTDITPLKRVCDYAHQRNLKVLVHSTGAPVPMSDIFDVLQKGDVCTHLFHGGKHNVGDDNFLCMEKAARKGIILDNGMAGGVHTDFAIVRTAIEKGYFPHTISTDITKLSAYIRGGNYGMTFIMTLMREMGMAQEKILECVTHAAAKAIGKEDVCGRLLVGRAADVSVLTYKHNSFEISDRWGNVLKGCFGYDNLLTLIDGQVVYRSNL